MPSALRIQKPAHVRVALMPSAFATPPPENPVTGVWVDGQLIGTIQQERGVSHTTHLKSKQSVPRVDAMWAVRKEVGDV